MLRRSTQFTSLRRIMVDARPENISISNRKGFHDESFVTLTFLSSEKDEETCVGYCTQSDSKEGPDILLILEKNGAHMEEIQNQA
ncbi:hypothetical protein OUZ56_027099 [Daphnia magna]|uniref:Uncharacterized protein n=1 Tax=Daphnia magna TaxID=35525 RepID=A0ABQ9ZNR8_9CRUS|nr:hypothetical protein OUZ56_027099 [Daphnia magna]